MNRFRKILSRLGVRYSRIRRVEQQQAHQGKAIHFLLKRAAQRDSEKHDKLTRAEIDRYVDFL